MTPKRSSRWNRPTRWAKAVFGWLQANGVWFFDGLSAFMSGLIAWLLWILQSPHPLVIAGVAVALTWFLQRSWKICLLVALCFLFVLNQGYWEPMTESLTLVLSACVVCMAVGVPIGIYAAHRPQFYQVLQPVLDLMQTLPTFVYLIPAVAFFSIGKPPGVLATVIFAMPPMIRLTALGIRQVPQTVKEAALATFFKPIHM